MGGIVSAGNNNDDLIDNLLEVDYIKTSAIERVFRAVDRAEYFLPEGRPNAYKDIAWKNGNLHLSAPCIYSEVMEGLCLKPGLSFLNLGSGTGYLSTMVGLIVGHQGINHGIEFYDDVVQYANKKLLEFKKYSGAVDEFDFCEPVFVQGNGLCLSNENPLYDRVYCGASCPQSYEAYMKSLLKVGGILVIPINEHLLQIKRKSENEWTSKTLLPVSFASLIQPQEGCQESVPIIEVDPPSLQALSRCVIRNILRRNIELELPPPPKRIKKAPLRKERLLRKFVVPLFDDDSSDDEVLAPLREEGHWVIRDRSQGNARARLVARDEVNFVAEFLDRHLEFLHRVQGRVSEVRNEIDAINEEQEDEGVEVQVNGDENMEPNLEDNNVEHDDKPTIVKVEVDHHLSKPGSSQMSVNDADLTDNSMVANFGSSVCSDLSDEQKREMEHDSMSSHSDNREEEPSCSKPTTNERRKFDSGIGDENEIVELGLDGINDNFRSFESLPTDDEQLPHKRTKRSSKVRCDQLQSRPKWRRIAVENSDSSDNSSDNETDENIAEENNHWRMYKSRFTEPMRNKIRSLPLPPILKNYLNFYREI